jgi:hypothetical protein
MGFSRVILALCPLAKESSGRRSPNADLPLPVHPRSTDTARSRSTALFSGFAVYVGDNIVLMLRDSLKHPEDNGIWLVFSETASLADPSIRRDFPSLRIIGLLGGKIGHWRLIPADSPNFESAIPLKLGSQNHVFTTTYGT